MVAKRDGEEEEGWTESLGLAYADKTLLLLIK